MDGFCGKVIMLMETGSQVGTSWSWGQRISMSLRFEACQCRANTIRDAQYALRRLHATIDLRAKPDVHDPLTLV
jgi:hypothetical protein